MYLGFFVGWGGLWVIFGQVNAGPIAVSVAAVLGVNLFVLFF
jgi:hypothetical protein